MKAAALWLKRNVDARWFLITSNVLLITTGFLFAHLRRSLFQIETAFAGAIAIEFICLLVSKRLAGAKLFDRSLSAIASAASLLILVRSHEPYYYLVAVAIAIGSKYLLLRPDRRHIFNPTNFALIVTFALFPAEIFSTYPDEYQLMPLPYFTVTALGLIATTISGTWSIVIAYALTNVMIAFLLAPIFKLSFFYLLAPDVGIIGLIFMFFMMTDPRTTPRTLNGKLAFGFSVAVLNIALRDLEMAYSYFVALFIVTLISQLKWVLGIDKTLDQSPLVKRTVSQ